jgi:hypothetical protein
MKDLNRVKSLIKATNEIKKNNGVVNGVVPTDKLDSFTREIELVLKNDRLNSEQTNGSKR